MAESLLFGIAELFIGKLTSRAVKEASLALGVFNDLQEMKDTVLIIKGVLLDAEQKQHHNNAMREWLRQIKRVFHDAEDLIDDFECEALQKQLINTSSGSIGRKVRRFFSKSSNPLAYRLRMAHEIKDIKKRLDKVAADRLKFGLQINDRDNRTVVQRTETHSRVDNLDVVGREHDKHKIIDLLLQDHHDDDDDTTPTLSVIPIVGMGGLGKTTLAKSVFNNKNIVESFPLRMWVSISNDFNLKQLLIKILNSATHPETFKNFSVEQLQNHLTNVLTGQKFLLVLDDVLPAIKLSFDQLPSYLKPCFACFSLIEKGYEFSSVDVIQIWEALSFLPSPKKGQTKQDVGNQLLLELHARSLLQISDPRFLLGCKLHDLVHDFALYVAGDEFQIIKPHSENISENIVLHLTVTENYLLGQIPIPNYLRLRAIFFPEEEADNEVFLNTLVTRCKYLRVLHINNSNYERLPCSIGKLKHLRYLNLSCNEKLNSLPDSVCQLQNLRSLNLIQCTHLQTLPNGIGNLINLQVLTITTNQSTFPNEEIAKLTSLEILGLSSCHNLESLFEGIQLPSLKLLVLDSCEELKFVSLPAFANLETLAIDYCGELNLSMCYDNQIPKLNLKFLSLGSLPQLVTFPQWLQGCTSTLQSLEIEDCENLEELPKWLTNVTCLKSISIRECKKLSSLPYGVHPKP